METSTLDDSIQEVDEEKTDKMDDDIQVVEAVTLEEKTDKVDDSIQEVDDEVIPEKTKLVKDNDSAITLEEDVDNDDDEGVTCGTVGANFDVSDRMRLRHL